MKFLILTFVFLILNLSGKSQPLPETQLRSTVCHNWKANSVIKPTEKKPARTAILIIAAPKYGRSFVEDRWVLGEKLWEQYLHCHPNVDCFFLKPAPLKKDSTEQVWIEGNTIFVGDIYYDRDSNDRLLYKTIQALKFLIPNYTHFIRTNINTFINLKAAHNYMETHHRSMFTGPLWQTSWYPFGYGLIFTKDVAEHMVSEFERLDKMQESKISHHHGDDQVLASLATGILPGSKRNPFRCCPSLTFGVRQLMCSGSLNTRRMAKYGALLSPLKSAEEGIRYCQLASDEVIIYRTRDGLNLEQIAQVYEYMLDKNYPGLHHIDLKQYARYLDSTR